MASQESSTLAKNTGITAPLGFCAAAVTAGIKPSGNSDMAMIHNKGPLSTSTAVFTRNRVVAAPVKWTRAHNDGHFQAVVVNAGNANACTGAQGYVDTQDTAEYAAKLLGIEAAQVAICSTGLIGDTLPMDKVLAGVHTLVPALSSEPEAGHAAARAIMTTDCVSKETVYYGQGWTVGAMGKGVGMIAPSLATMLIFLTTDAYIEDPEQLHEALSAAAATTVECLDVDGATSTNDTVLLMASGASGVVPDQQEFARAIHQVCLDMALQLQADAEGVTKRISITVSGATTMEEARAAARVIGRDSLFKCAMFGSDPNWGRVLAAVGMAPVRMDPEKISVSFNGHPVCRDSTGAPGARQVDLSGADIAVDVHLGVGDAQATVWTTDLSYSYVEINSEYST